MSREKEEKFKNISIFCSYIVEDDFASKQEKRVETGFKWDLAGGKTLKLVVVAVGMQLR